MKYVGKPAASTRWTYEFQGVRNQIDHILLSRSIVSASDVETEFVEQTDSFASDHRPMVVTIEF